MDAVQPKLCDYFQAVERRFHAHAEMESTQDIRIAGRTLRFVFTDEERAASIIQPFTGLLVDDALDQEPDARFFYWTEDLDPYLPDSACGGDLGVWTSADETGYLNIMRGYSLMGADYQRSCYYICIEKDKSDLFETYSHAMIVSLFRWAIQNGMMLLHAAAVGVDGTGVLLGGYGGKGKSTLSVACLRSGLQFVSDDYTLLRKVAPSAGGDACANDGSAAAVLPIMAEPLYRTVCLNPDMAELLNMDLPVLRTYEWRGDKRLYDASSCAFAEHLPIKGIVIPQFDPRIAGDADRPSEIIAVHPGRAITQIVHSSLTQFSVMRETSLVKEMLSYLSGLPVYRFVLGEDPMANAMVLERFIRSLS